MIRTVYDLYIGRKYFYHYETLLVRFALPKLAVRRQYRDFVFLHKVLHGVVDSIDLLSFVDFHVPSRVSTNGLTFYPSFMSSVSPLSRIQLAFNKAHLDISLCSHQFMFHVRK